MVALAFSQQANIYIDNASLAIIIVSDFYNGFLHC